MDDVEQAGLQSVVWDDDSGFQGGGASVEVEWKILNQFALVEGVLALIQVVDGVTIVFSAMRISDCRVDSKPDMGKFNAVRELSLMASGS